MIPNFNFNTSVIIMCRFLKMKFFVGSSENPDKNILK